MHPALRLGPWIGRLLVVAGAGLGVWSVGTAGASAEEAVPPGAAQVVDVATAVVISGAERTPAPAGASPVAFVAAPAVADTVEQVATDVAPLVDSEDLAPIAETVVTRARPLLEFRHPSTPLDGDLAGLVGTVRDGVVPPPAGDATAAPAVMRTQAEVITSAATPPRADVRPARADVLPVEHSAQRPASSIAPTPGDVPGAQTRPGTPAAPAPPRPAGLQAGGSGARGVADTHDGGHADLTGRAAGIRLAGGGRSGDAPPDALRLVAFDPSFSPD